MDATETPIQESRLGKGSDAAALVRNPAIGSIRERKLEAEHLGRRQHRALPVETRNWPRVSVVIPARDEADNLPIVFKGIPQEVFEIVVVTDGSRTDKTADVARALRDDVRIVRQDGKGKGDALISGFNACRGDIIVMLDADGSMDPAEIQLYVDELVGGADFVKGSRYMTGGGSTDLTPFRNVGNNGLRVAVNMLFGTRYTDLCYGYSGFWRWTLPYLALDCDGFEVETLMNIRAHTTGLNVSEVPSMEYDRIHGASKLHPIRDGLRILRVIVAERLRPRRAKHAQLESASSVQRKAA
jgi:glycosyltransferase involved in cell wall biosynthesis